MACPQAQQPAKQSKIVRATAYDAPFSILFDYSGDEISP